MRAPQAQFCSWSWPGAAAAAASSSAAGAGVEARHASQQGCGQG